MFYHILAFMTFLPILTVCHIFMLSFVFYSHLKMTLKRSKRRHFLALAFITKSISKELLIKYAFVFQTWQIIGYWSLLRLKYFLDRTGFSGVWLYEWQCFFCFTVLKPNNQRFLCYLRTS